MKFRVWCLALGLKGFIGFVGFTGFTGFVGVFVFAGFVGSTECRVSGAETQRLTPSPQNIKQGLPPFKNSKCVFKY